ncbi:uncharacterized protein LOC119600324 [Lucilia sericata]|uniref:uncharacterized protein LOC119600324 n=1 Tax=Lucilia sericata TaxID=13632 RepID=UPI0018A872EE|nr:uncharacterized protein LOC119600324 [Lucilia sericata]
MSDNSKDCLECRLISGFGLIGVSAYIYYQARHRKRWENYTMNIISAGVGVLGGARLLNLPFLKSTRE